MRVEREINLRLRQRKGTKPIPPQRTPAADTPETTRAPGTRWRLQSWMRRHLLQELLQMPMYSRRTATGGRKANRGI